MGDGGCILIEGSSPVLKRGERILKIYEGPGLKGPGPRNMGLTIVAING